MHRNLNLMHRKNAKNELDRASLRLFSSYAFFTPTYTHVKVEIHFNVAFEVNKCFDGENSAFATIQHAFVILFLKYKLVRRG